MTIKKARVLSAVLTVCMILAAFAVCIPAAAAEDAFTNLYDKSTSFAGYLNASYAEVAAGIHFTSAKIGVTAGNVIYFGPANSAQGYHLVGYGADGSVVTGLVNKNSLTVSETFSNGTVAYAYTVPQNVVSLRIVDNPAYNDMFVVTKNQKFTVAQFNDYWTARSLNVSAVTGMGDDGAVSADKLVNTYDKSKALAGYLNGKFEEVKNSIHYTTDYIPVKTGDTVYFGPAKSSQNYHLIGFNAEKEHSTSLINSSGLRQTAKFDSDTVIFAYTVPANVSYVRIADQPAVNDIFLVTVNQVFNVRTYHEYQIQHNKDNGNLFFAGTAMNGYIGASGIVTSSDYLTNTPVAVSAGDKLRFGPVNDSMVSVGAVYGADGKIIKSLKPSDVTKNETLADGSYFVSYTVTAGTASVRVSSPAKLGNAFMFTLNKSFTVDEYTDYFNLEVIVPRTDGVLNGKTALFVGDSICDACYDTLDGWAGRILLHNNMKGLNTAVSGASLSTIRSGNRIITQLKNHSNENYDYIIIQGGTNDGWGTDNIPAPVGTVGDSFDLNDFNVSTYAGALEEIFYYATKNFPDTHIGYIINYATPLSTTGKLADMSKYYTVGKQICEKWGIEYLDLYFSSEITETLHVDNKDSTLLYDNIHVNNDGYRLLYPYVEKFMEGLEVYTGPSSGDVTEAPVVTDAPAGTTVETRKKGCGGTAGYSLIGLVMMFGGGVTFAVIRRKK